ncbi:MAG: metal-dependent hydrolase [Desulfovibrionaceae bacterium]
MDPVTHAASGALAMLALPSRPATRWAVPLAALAAAAPDADVLLGWTPLLALETHRGFSHALALSPLWGLLLALIMLPLRRPGGWSLRCAWLFSTLMICLHIWLDAVTTYGTLALLPFSDLRVRGNALFIIDPWLTLPLLAALLAFRTRYGRNAALAGLCWALLYPAGMLCLQQWHEAQARRIMPRAEELHVLPDVLAPFHWRVLARREGRITVRAMDWRGRMDAPAPHLPAAPSALLETLAAQDASCFVFRRFALLPVLRLEDGGAWLVHDLRFGTCLPWAAALLERMSRPQSPFQLRARLRPDGTVEAVRLQYASGDSGWHAPRPPRRDGPAAALGLY